MEQNQYQPELEPAKRRGADALPSDEPQGIDLLMLFNALRRHILIIIAVALVFALAAGGYVQFFVTPMYVATTSTYLVSPANDISSILYGLSLSNNVIGDYADIIKSRTILEEVIDKMNAEYDAQVAAGEPTTMNSRLNYGYGVLYGKVQVINPTDTHILKISVTDADPVMARDIANALTYYVVDQLADIVGITVPTVYDPAIAPSSPSSPNLTGTVVKAFAIGAVLAAGIIVLITIMDTTVKTAEDIENRCGMVTLTKVYYEGGKKKKGYGYGYGGYGYYSAGSAKSAGSSKNKPEKSGGAKK